MICTVLTNFYVSKHPVKESDSDAFIFLLKKVHSIKSTRWERERATEKLYCAIR